VLFVKLNKYLARIVPDQIPGAVCWIGTTKRTLFFEAFGYAQVEPRKVRISKETVFDLASITKPFATATAIMKCVAQGALRLHDPVARYLGEFKNTVNNRVTIAKLLTHSSGLPAWFPLYIIPEDTRMPYMAQTTLRTPQVVYSCLGYIILGILIKRVTGQDVSSFCQNHIFKPLHLDSMRFSPDTIRNIAATEKGDQYERSMTAEFCDPTIHKWRNRVIRGEVHDGNCFYAYKGISGNAGLFGNAPDCGRFLQSLLNHTILPKKYVTMMIQDHTGGHEKRGLGWWVDPFPEFFSHGTFAHTGFTGTMVCVDPMKDIIIVLLTNAIHPHVRQEVKRRIRRKVVEIVAGTLLR